MSIRIYEKKDYTAYITMNRPPLNTMSVERSAGSLSRHYMTMLMPITFMLA